MKGNFSPALEKRIGWTREIQDYMYRWLENLKSKYPPGTKFNLHHKNPKSNYDMNDPLQGVACYNINNLVILTEEQHREAHRLLAIGYCPMFNPQLVTQDLIDSEYVNIKLRYQR